MSESDQLDRIRRAREEARRRSGGQLPVPGPVFTPPNAPPSPFDVTTTTAEDVGMEVESISLEAPVRRSPLERAGAEAMIGLDTGEGAEKAEEVTARTSPKKVAAARKRPSQSAAVLAMLRSRSGLRQAVLAQEVLGPPKSLREMDDRLF